ncbi:MAG: NAD-binding protein, partial [Xanthomonadales bacterium]|nr:NAD-binding protein [Xanthomonadales bacterium]
MRRMRAPLIVMLIVYFISVVGMVIIPGTGADGEPYRMGFLDAVYFVAVTATTTGFGEIPTDYNGAQRLWVMAVIFPNVVAWLYAIGTILGLFLDPQFQRVLARTRFVRRVRWLGEPFFIVCGLGNTGSMVVRGLLARGLSAVVVEGNEDTVHRMALDDELARVPALTGDVGDRRVLALAGLHGDNCRGVIACTDDDHVNLTIAITSKLLEPDLPVLARSESQRVSDNMASFGTDFVVNPYTIFAERMFLALSSPVKYLVQDWLISVPGSRLREPLDPPVGRWIVCGVGRFGERMVARLEESGLPYTVVDVHPERLEGHEHAVEGRGTEEHTLREAGVEDAAGIIAGTGDDVDNLSIIMTALAINPRLFVVARQEHERNSALFDASGAHVTARRSLIVARRILAVATTPLLQTFLQYLVRQDDEFAERVKGRLEAVLEGFAPSLWVITLKDDLAASLRAAASDGVRVELGHITHNTRSERSESLDCVCLVLERGAQRLFLPDPEQDLMEGDRLLFAGRGRARREMMWALSDPNALIGYATGLHLPRGAIWRWWWRRRAAAAKDAAGDAS